MKNALTFLLGMICISVSAQNQSNTPDTIAQKSNFRISIIPAFSNMDFGNLNTILASKGLPSVKDGLQYTTFGSVTFPLAGVNWDLTGGISYGKNDLNGYSMEQRIMYLEWGFEVYSWHKGRHNAFFNIAYGVASYTVDIYENTGNTSFSGALDDFDGTVKIESKNNRYIALRAAYDWSVSKKDGFDVGLRFGYRIGLGAEKLEINNQDYSDGPESSAGEFFVGIAFSIR